MSDISPNGSGRDATPYLCRLRFGEYADVALEVKQLAYDVALSCGAGKVLNLGSGEGWLVAELLALGIDAVGVDESDAAVARSIERIPARFHTVDSFKVLPFSNDEFDTVVSLGALEDVPEEDVSTVLEELRRITRRYAFLRIDTAAGENGKHRTSKHRAWWERKCFEAGFRKSTSYYDLNAYESLNHDGESIDILLERIPDSALARYPLQIPAEERDSRRDMLRETGAWSDAHVARYKWASAYVRPGDRVLDATCSLGYGSYYIAQMTKATSVLGVDGSEYAIDYGARNFSILDKKLSYKEGFLPQCLADYEDGRFDTIISFETLEHVEDPVGLIAEFKRLLTPGGRVIVSVPNDWSDETGEDPNPYHLHVYTLDKLKQQISVDFMPEVLFQQIASGCESKEPGQPWRNMPRTLRKIDIDVEDPPVSEWWLMVAMKDPAEASVPYREGVYGYSSPPEHVLAFERDYENPWLVHSMQELGFRCTSPQVLAEVARNVIDDSHGRISADVAAALAVQGYQILIDRMATAKEVESFIGLLMPYVDGNPGNPHLYRWQVSHTYLIAELLKKIGRLDEAYDLFDKVSRASISEFNPSLGTKIIDAAYKAGLLAAGKGMINQARTAWTRGVERTYEFLRMPLPEFVGDIELPIEFPTIDAVEFLDSSVRCLKALRWTNENENRNVSRLFAVSNDNWKMSIAERDKAIVAQGRLLEQRWEMMRSQEDQLLERWKIIESMNVMIEERDQVIRNQGEMLEQRWSLMRAYENRLDAQSIIISAYRNMAPSLNGLGLIDRVIEAEAPSPFLNLALPLYVFIRKLHEQARADGVKDLLFFAREGKILKEMFDFFQSFIDESERVNSHYCLVSRRATFLPSLGPLDTENFDVLFRQYRRISLADFLKSLALDDFIPEFAAEMDIHVSRFDVVSEDLPTDPVFKQLIALAGFRQVYERERVSRSDALRSYIEDLLGHALGNRLSVVDVGWKGSIQDNLFNWFRNQQGPEASMDGYYVGLVAPGAISEKNRKAGLLFSCVAGVSKGFSVFNENRSLFEVALHADHGSAQRYGLDENGKPVVTLDLFAEQEMIESRVAPVSDRIIALYQKIVAVGGVFEREADALFAEAMKRHSRMVFDPTQEEIDWMLSVSHVENFGVFEESSFGGGNDHGFADKLKFSWRLVSQRRLGEAGFWPWLTIKRHALPGTSALYRMYREWQN